MTELQDEKDRELSQIVQLMRPLSVNQNQEENGDWIQDANGTRVYYNNTDQGMFITSIWEGNVPLHATPENGDMVVLTQGQLDSFRLQNPELYAALDAVDATIQRVGEDQRARTYALE
jgi:hypothetical protein